MWVLSTISRKIDIGTWERDWRRSSSDDVQLVLRFETSQISISERSYCTLVAKSYVNIFSTTAPLINKHKRKFCQYPAVLTSLLAKKNKTSKVTEIILRIEHARETCVTV